MSVSDSVNERTSEPMSPWESFRGEVSERMASQPSCTTLSGGPCGVKQLRWHHGVLTAKASGGSFPPPSCNSCTFPGPGTKVLSPPASRPFLHTSTTTLPRLAVCSMEDFRMISAPGYIGSPPHSHILGVSTQHSLRTMCRKLSPGDSLGKYMQGHLGSRLVPPGLRAESDRMPGPKETASRFPHFTSPSC